jgi:hypothetical protein
MKLGSTARRLPGVVVLLAVAGFASVAGYSSSATEGADSPDGSLENGFAKTIRPLIASHCQRCHGNKRTEAEVDLEHMQTLVEVRKHPRVWQKVAEMLESRQMPPMGAKQLTEADRDRFQRWVHEHLTLEARASAGDPGPVVLRRLSNAEYTYTLRDLTGIQLLEPAREFPVDGAAGEGFTNTGNALVMSPTLLTKYLDAAKDVANHAVLLPDGFVFSPHTTRRDWTDDTLAKIRGFYQQFTDPNGGDKVNLQGIVFDTNQGGRLPVEKYLHATLVERAALKAKQKSIEQVARAHGLNARYLHTLWTALTGSEPSFLLDRLRARWHAATPRDAAVLAADVAAWQKELWKFNTVGQIGKVGGPRAWMEPVTPITTQQELRFKIPAAPTGKEVTLYLVAGSADDGNKNDVVLWQQPRLVSPGRRDFLLRDVREISNDLERRRDRLFANTARYLGAAAEAAAATARVDTTQIAKKHGLDAEGLEAWLDCLGIGAAGPIKIDGYFKTKLNKAGGYDFIQGWGTSETPLLLANSSDRHVRIPGNMRPHSVAVHPSPTLQAAVGWRSPIVSTVRVEAEVTHAHPECGNGVTWSLELRRGATRQKLAAGVSQGGKPVRVGPINDLAIQEGDLISLLIGPRDGNHACDLTLVDLKIAGKDGRTWNLDADTSGHIQASNPLPDRFGHPGVWHFYTEPDRGVRGAGSVIPTGSLLAKWQTARTIEEKQTLSGAMQKLLLASSSATAKGPDGDLYRQLVSLNGPLFRSLLEKWQSDKADSTTPKQQASAKTNVVWGLHPAQFGKHPSGSAVDPASICVRAPSVIEIRLPADLVAGSEFVTTGRLEPKSGQEGSVQLRLLTSKPHNADELLPTNSIVVADQSQARQRIEAGIDEFRNLFPAALCYSKIVPVDEVITLTLFYREDSQLTRLMLDEKQKKHLDRLWDELRFISQDSLTLVDAFAQLMEYASQDADPKVFEPLRKPINDRAAAFRKRLVDCEPRQLNTLIEFAGKAYRRPLTEEDKRELRDLYAKLRKQELPHEKAFRLTLAKVLVSPSFLYKLERPPAGAGQGPVSAFELANRLSYFLWSSEPDSQLMATAARGKLHSPQAAVDEARRMLRDERVRRMATEFACQWLHINDFDHLDEKSERHFPTFLTLRGAMYEESIRFFTYLFQDDRPVSELLDADYTFLNEALAKHYGIPGVAGPEWRKVEGIKQYDRGGLLGLATTLAKQSGASRTSPILRGNWISEVLLGERLPRPPKDVPRLPEDETATQGLTVRQLVEKHSSDPRCAVCHQRIDAFGFSLEAFDAIGRHREKDLGDRAIDTRVQTMDGTKFDGIAGLRAYLLTQRRDAFLRQFCRKLLGYALGRSVQLSDEPLLAEMLEKLKDKNCRMSSLVTSIVSSRQFREIRGKLAASEE